MVTQLSADEKFFLFFLTPFQGYFDGSLLQLSQLLFQVTWEEEEKSDKKEMNCLMLRVYKLQGTIYSVNDFECEEEESERDIRKYQVNKQWK